ncbi:MAG: type II toxin-antitoxin system HicA family toxin [Phycisphaerae bacterium]|nr:type II toxin-antitoxin system HicA family toxin [Phycisphaerae bacterium]
MGKLHDLPTQRVIKALKRDGWELRGGGKHHKLLNSKKPGALTIPRGTPLKRGTLRAIIKQAGLSVDEFLKLYK